MSRRGEAKEQFKKAYDLLENGKYEEALSGFCALSALYPDIYSEKILEPFLNRCGKELRKSIRPADMVDREGQYRNEWQKTVIIEDTEKIELLLKAMFYHRKEQTGFDQFSALCGVDCDVLKNHGYSFVYDEMTYSARIFRQNRFLKSLNDGSLANKHMALLLNMFFMGKQYVLYPVLWLRQKRFLRPIDEVCIQIGDDCYRTRASEVLTLTILGKTYDSAKISLGLPDLDLLRKMAKKEHSAAVRFGEEMTETVPNRILDEISEFLDMCEEAGVLRQPALKEEPARFLLIAKPRPDA